MHRLALVGMVMLGACLTQPAAYAAKNKPGAAAKPPPVGDAATSAALSALPDPMVVQYNSNGLSLKAWIYKPEGPGPFPVIVSNHGSGKPVSLDKTVAQFWLSQGFVFFRPARSGHGDNPGAYIGDETAPIKAKVRAALANPKTTPAELQKLYDQAIALHKKANGDVVAAFRWLVTQPYVDPARVVVTGGSYGGIQTLLMASANKQEHLGIRGFIAMSPAAESWEFGKPRPQDPGHENPEGNTAFARYLTDVIKNSEGPIFLMQAHNDYSLGPTTYLGPVVEARGAPNRCAVFPTHGSPTDPTQGHGKFFMDPSAWAPQVWDYLQAIGEVPAATTLVSSAATVSPLPKPGTVPPRRGSGLAIETCGPGE
ncbi:hypothetical protein BH10PSE9_BH10PSE9_20690 [soil metagenome]